MFLLFVGLFEEQDSNYYTTRYDHCADEIREEVWESLPDGPRRDYLRIAKGRSGQCASKSGP